MQNEYSELADSGPSASDSSFETFVASLASSQVLEGAYGVTPSLTPSTGLPPLHPSHRLCQDGAVVCIPAIDPTTHPRCCSGRRKSKASNLESDCIMLWHRSTELTGPYHQSGGAGTRPSKSVRQRRRGRTWSGVKVRGHCFISIGVPIRIPEAWTETDHPICL